MRGRWPKPSREVRIVADCSHEGPIAGCFQTVALGSLLAVIGYVHGVKSLHAIAPFWTMEVNSALALTLLCVGLLFARPDRGLMAIVTSDSAAGVMARRFLPPAILMPAVLGWLVFAGQQAGLYGAEIGLLLVVVSSIIFPAALIGGTPAHYIGWMCTASRRNAASKKTLPK